MVTVLWDRDRNSCVTEVSQTEELRVGELYVKAEGSISTPVSPRAANVTWIHATRCVVIHLKIVCVGKPNTALESMLDWKSQLKERVFSNNVN